MSSQHDLLSYLSEQASDGVKDSEGDFTVSQQNARKKLAKFALPRETAWVSKLVQAAVGWGMTRILVAQSKNETQIFFQTRSPGQLPTPNELVNALLSGKIVLDTPLDHFSLGLRALVEQAGLSFLLVANDGEVLPKPIYAGAHFGQMSEGARLDKRYDRAAGMTLTVRHSPPLSAQSDVSELFGLSEFGLPIIEELRDYAYASPVPIIYEGRHLEGILDSPLLGNSQVPLLQSGLSKLEHSPERLRLPPCFEEKHCSYRSHPRRVRRSYGGEKQFACGYILAAKSPPTNWRERRSTLRWVRDGVIVQASSLDTTTQWLSLHLFANAEGLKSDLTGFQLVLGDEFFARRAEILRTLGQEIMTWYDRADEFFREDRDEKSQTDDEYEEDRAFRKRVKVLLKGSAAGLMLTLVNPPFGIAATLGSVANAYRQKFLKPHVMSDSKREHLIGLVKGDLITLSQDLLRIGREDLEPPEKPAKLGQIDPKNQLEIEDMFRFYEDDPVGLAEALKSKAARHKDQPQWNLHLARAYALTEDQRAGMYFNRYLDLCPEGEVFEELATFYKKSGKETMAQMVSWRKDNPNAQR
jgi:hypothetical protein